MPALASLSQEDLDALAAEQAAQDAAAAAAAAPPPDPAAAAPVPPPADAGAAYGMGVPATDPAVTYAQDPAAAPVAPPPAAAPAPAPVPASTSEATVDPTYAAPVASPSTDTYQPSRTTFVDGNGNTGFVPAPAPSPAPTPPVQGATAVTRTIPASTSEAGRTGGDPNYRTFTPSGVLAPVATPPPSRAPYASPSTDTYQPRISPPLGALRGGMWDPSVPASTGYTTQDLADTRQANLKANSGATRGRSEMGVALGLPYLGLWDAPMAPDVGLPSGGGKAGKPYPIPGEAGYFVDVAEPGKVSPTTVKTRYRVDPVTGERTPYVPTRPRVEPNIIPDAPVPPPGATEAQLIAERESRRAGNAPRPIVDPQSPAAQEAAFQAKMAEQARPVTTPTGKPTAPPPDPTKAWAWDTTTQRWINTDEPAYPQGETTAAGPNRGIPLGKKTVPVDGEGYIVDATTGVRTGGRVRMAGREAAPASNGARPAASPVEAPVPEPRPVTAASEPIPVTAEGRPVEPAITEPVPEPTTGAGQATEPVVTEPTGPAAKRPGLVKRIITPTKKKVLVGAGLGVLGAKEYLGVGAPASKPAGAPAGTTTSATAPARNPQLKTGEKEVVGKDTGVHLIQNADGDYTGVFDENNKRVDFPADATDEQIDAIVGKVQRRTAKQQKTDTTDTAATAAVNEPTETAGSAIPISTITGATDTGTSPASGGSGEPLVTSDGTDTGTSDGGTKKASGGSSTGYVDENGNWQWYDDYSKGKSSGSYHKSYGSSSSHYSSKKKKKKGSSSFGGSSSGMWDGFPFNRPPSSIRQLVLDAIASSQAKGKSKK